MDTNPELIQLESWQQPKAKWRAAPMFFIHDGSGTTFDYHSLDPLGRTVYGIHNPNFYTGEKFDGGLSEMGHLYSKLIKNVIVEPGFPARRNFDGSINIFLGGRSLGGLLSLQVAWNLSDDEAVRIIGIVMIDSVCPIRSPEMTLSSSWHPTERGKTKNQILSQRAMAEALHMILAWDPPVWNGSLKHRRPRISMLLASDSVPVKGENPHIVDIYRAHSNLGWDQYDEDIFSEVVKVDGDHFNMFSFDRIPRLTEVIRDCLHSLEMQTNACK